jgi:prepilin-type N-terminal cleavage/methylation domain-containing protein
MNNRGFTLIELQIVIGIMAILMAFATPSMIQWREDARIRGVASDIMSGLRQARSLAITNNQDVTSGLVITVGDHQLTYGETTQTFPMTITLEAWNDSTPADGVEDEGEWVSSTRSADFRSQGSCLNVLSIRVNEGPNLSSELIPLLLA